MDKIVPAFETTLFDPTLSDACIDMAELGIDSLLDEGVFKSIPIVSVLVGLGKAAQKIEKYKNHLDSNPKYAEEELGRVIILLNSNVDLKKSELLAKFYRSYINGDIDWSTFCELSDITSRLFISDLHLLFEVSKGRISDTSQCQTYKADRLIALGLLDSAMKSMSIGSLSGSQTQRYIQVNNLGKLFCKIAQQ